jgi:hypothetical protein
MLDQLLNVTVMICGTWAVGGLFIYGFLKL